MSESPLAPVRCLVAGVVLWIVPGLLTGAGATSAEPPRRDADEAAKVVVPGRAAPLLPALRAVREARAAVKSHPDDAKAYLQLGRAYEALSQEEQRQFGQRMPELTQLRDTQATAVLRNAIRLDPDSGDAHLLLSNLFRRAGFADLTLKHLGEAVRLTRRAGRRSGETEEEFKDRLQSAEKELAELERQVKDNRLKYELRSEKQRVLDRARIAMQLGLAQTALKVLLDSDVLEFGVEGARLEIDLLLRTGDCGGLRDQLTLKDPKESEKLAKELSDRLGVGVYERYRFLLATAEGDFKEADLFLVKVEKQVMPDRDLLRQSIAAHVAKAIADQAPQGGPVAGLLWPRLQQQQQLAMARHLANHLQMWATYETLRGILKLETGDVGGAKDHFQHVLFGDKKPKGAEAKTVIDFPGMPVAYRYLEVSDRLKRADP
jgi:tetratricopeptide (TPR) repeat protein